MFLRRQLESMAHETDQAIIGINLLNEIVICNPPAASLFELVVEDIIGKDIWQSSREL